MYRVLNKNSQERLKRQLYIRQIFLRSKAEYFTERFHLILSLKLCNDAGYLCEDIFLKKHENSASTAVKFNRIFWPINGFCCFHYSYPSHKPSVKIKWGLDDKINKRSPLIKSLSTGSIFLNSELRRQRVLNNCIHLREYHFYNAFRSPRGGSLGKVKRAEEEIAKDIKPLKVKIISACFKKKFTLGETKSDPRENPDHAEIENVNLNSKLPIPLSADTILRKWANRRSSLEAFKKTKSRLIESFRSRGSENVKRNLETIPDFIATEKIDSESETIKNPPDIAEDSLKKKSDAKVVVHSSAMNQPQKFLQMVPKGNCFKNNSIAKTNTVPLDLGRATFGTNKKIRIVSNKNFNSLLSCYNQPCGRPSSTSLKSEQDNAEKKKEAEYTEKPKSNFFWKDETNRGTLFSKAKSHLEFRGRQFISEELLKKSRNELQSTKGENSIQNDGVKKLTMMASLSQGHPIDGSNLIHKSCEKIITQNFLNTKSDNSIKSNRLKNVGESLLTKMSNSEPEKVINDKSYTLASSSSKADTVYTEISNISDEKCEIPKHSTNLHYVPSKNSSKSKMPKLNILPENFSLLNKYNSRKSGHKLVDNINITPVYSGTSEERSVNYLTANQNTSDTGNKMSDQDIISRLFSCTSKDKNQTKIPETNNYQQALDKNENKTSESTAPDQTHSVTNSSNDHETKILTTSSPYQNVPTDIDNSANKTDTAIQNMQKHYENQTAEFNAPSTNHSTKTDNEINISEANAAYQLINEASNSQDTNSLYQYQQPVTESAASHYTYASQMHVPAKIQETKIENNNTTNELSQNYKPAVGTNQDIGINKQLNGNNEVKIKICPWKYKEPTREDVERLERGRKHWKSVLDNTALNGKLIKEDVVPEYSTSKITYKKHSTNVPTLISEGIKEKDGSSTLTLALPIIKKGQSVSINTSGNQININITSDQDIKKGNNWITKSQSTSAVVIGSSGDAGWNPNKSIRERDINCTGGSFPVGWHSRSPGITGTVPEKELSILGDEPTMSKMSQNSLNLRQHGPPTIDNTGYNYVFSSWDFKRGNDNVTEKMVYSYNAQDLNSQPDKSKKPQNLIIPFENKVEEQQNATIASKVDKYFPNSVEENELKRIPTAKMAVQLAQPKTFANGFTQDQNQKRLSAYDIKGESKKIEKSLQDGNLITLNWDKVAATEKIVRASDGKKEYRVQGRSLNATGNSKNKSYDGTKFGKYHHSNISNSNQSDGGIVVKEDNSDVNWYSDYAKRKHCITCRGSQAKGGKSECSCSGDAAIKSHDFKKKINFGKVYSKGEIRSSAKYSTRKSYAHEFERDMYKSEGDSHMEMELKNLNPRNLKPIYDKSSDETPKLYSVLQCSKQLDEKIQASPKAPSYKLKRNSIKTAFKSPLKEGSSEFLKSIQSLSNSTDFNKQFQANLETRRKRKIYEAGIFDQRDDLTWRDEFNCKLYPNPQFPLRPKTPLFSNDPNSNSVKGLVKSRSMYAGKLKSLYNAMSVLPKDDTLSSVKTETAESISNSDGIKVKAGQLLQRVEGSYPNIKLSTSAASLPSLSNSWGSCPVRNSSVLSSLYSTNFGNEVWNCEYDCVVGKMKAIKQIKKYFGTVSGTKNPNYSSTEFPTYSYHMKEVNEPLNSGSGKRLPPEHYFHEDHHPVSFRGSNESKPNQHVSHPEKLDPELPKQTYEVLCSQYSKRKATPKKFQEMDNGKAWDVAGSKTNSRIFGLLSPGIQKLNALIRDKSLWLSLRKRIETMSINNSEHNKVQNAGEKIFGQVSRVSELWRDKHLKKCNLGDFKKSQVVVPTKLCYSVNHNKYGSSKRPFLRKPVSRVLKSSQNLPRSINTSVRYDGKFSSPTRTKSCHW